MDERLRTAYATAMRAQQQGGRVEIHLGSDVIAYLRAARARVTDTEGTIFESGETCWGFPIIDTTASPDHISVHVVTTIA